MHCDCWHFTWSVVVSLTSHDRKKEAISPTHDYFLFKREAEKVMSMNITSHIIQGKQNRSDRPGDCKTDVCCIMPEKPADAISEILSSSLCIDI